MKIPVKKIQGHKANPRQIKEADFAALCHSLKTFPEMLEKRPLVCVTNEDGTYTVLGGNQRLRAAHHLGMAEIPVTLADDWTEEQRKEFIIRDNINQGQWDWDVIANEWDSEPLQEWGLEVPGVGIDYSILEGKDVDGQLKDMTDGVKKAIQIEFEAEHYESAYALVKFWREQGAYIGGMIMEFLKAEKESLQN